MGRYQMISGKIPHAKKVVVYGLEGVGKTTFASRFPDASFIDTEGSTKGHDVKRLPTPSSWTMLLDEVLDVIQSRNCKTLVIDTIDWAEKMCIQHICILQNWKGIEDPGYGAGYRYVYEEFGKLLNLLEDVIQAGIHVVLTGHAIINKFEQPDEMGAYDRYQLKLIDSKKTSISAMVKEWSDLLLFANYQTYVVQNKDKKVKGTGGQRRIMYTTHTAAWDAKNRDNLPDMLDFDFNQIAHLFSTSMQGVQEDKQTLSVSNIDTSMNLTDGMDKESPTFIESDVTKKTSLLSENETVNKIVIDWNTPEYQCIPGPLLDIMKANNIKEESIRKASSKYFPIDTPIANYPVDYIEHIMECKEEFIKIAKTQQDEFPF